MSAAAPEATHALGATDVAQTRIVRDTYCDSLRLLVATSIMSNRADVSWAGAVMATPSGRESLAAEGFGKDVTGAVGANDLVLAVRTLDEASAEAALDAGAAAAFAEADPGGDPPAAVGTAHPDPGSRAAQCGRRALRRGARKIEPLTLPAS